MVLYLVLLLITYWSMEDNFILFHFILTAAFLLLRFFLDFMLDFPQVIPFSTTNIKRLEISYNDGCICKSGILTLYFWCFIYPLNLAPKSKWKNIRHILLKLFPTDIFFHTPHKTRSFAWDHSIKFVNVNNTISNM